MSRVLALVGAVLLIVLAVLVRKAIDDDGGDDPGGDDGDELVVHCIPELAEACEAIDRPMELTIADPQATIDAVAAGEDIDAWVTLDPWPEIAALPDNDDALFEGAVGVAEDPLVLVVRPATLPGPCAEAPTFACVEADDPDRSPLRPPETALGLLAAGAGAADVFFAETGSAAFARQELFAGAAAAAHIEDFVFVGDPLEDMLEFGPSGPIVTIEPEHPAQERIDGTREEDNLELFALANPASVAVVVSGPQADRITGEPSFADALERLGWRLSPDARTTGLPPAGVLVALEDFIG